MPVRTETLSAPPANAPSAGVVSRVRIRRSQFNAATQRRGRVFTAIQLGFSLGLVESVTILLARFLERRLGDPDLWVNWHAPWMAPWSLAGLFAFAAIVLELFAHVAPRTASFTRPFVLFALGAWSALSRIPGLSPWAVTLLAAGLAIRCGPVVWSLLARPPGRTRTAVIMQLALGFGFVAACGIRFAFAQGMPSLTLRVGEFSSLALRGGAGRHSSVDGASAIGPRTNVLLVVLDTVRADHLSLYGYERRTSPNLESLARRGVRFDRARATTPFTLGTHASLFTGHWMSETSARTNAALDGALPTIAERLRDRGYATGGFVGNIFYGSAHYGLDRGFLHYEDVPGNITRKVTPRELVRSSNLGASILTWSERKLHILQPMQRQQFNAREVNRAALAWLDETQSTGRPFFLFLNYFDAHSPYRLPPDAPQPFSRVSAESLERRLKELDSSNVDHIREREEVGRLIADSYDDGIAWIDRQLGQLLAELERRGALENTLIIVTADHGEMLGEGGLIGHGQTLRPGVVHVPLVVVGAKGMNVPPETSVATPASLRDVPATILDLLGDRGANRFPGRSLCRFWNESGNGGDVVLSEVEHMPWQPHTPWMPAAFGPMWALTAGRFTYHRQDHETLGSVESLFDTIADPGEMNDLAGRPENIETLADFRGLFAQFVKK